MPMRSPGSAPPGEPGRLKVLGELAGWLVVVLPEVRMSGGLTGYRYSIAPGRVVTIVTVPGPDTPHPDDPLWMGELRDITRNTRRHP